MFGSEIKTGRRDGFYYGIWRRKDDERWRKRRTRLEREKRRDGCNSTENHDMFISH